MEYFSFAVGYIGTIACIAQLGLWATISFIFWQIIGAFPWIFSGLIINFHINKNIEQYFNKDNIITYNFIECLKGFIAFAPLIFASTWIIFLLVLPVLNLFFIYLPDILLKVGFLYITDAIYQELTTEIGKKSPKIEENTLYENIFGNPKTSL